MESSMNIDLLKRPLAWIPVAMSLAGLTLVVGHAMMYGIVHEADEGTPAHLFQILMVAQVPLVIAFAVKWLPRDPTQALRVLALQGVAVVAAFASVYWLT
jgi:hypothetical protein